jgi:poly-gamma-glutamate synthesis protein (capsule biosynthesis protein)
MYQKEIARAAIDFGADLVLQHHAHILRGIEVYKNKVIFYGLGNFAHESPRGRIQNDSDVKAQHELWGLKIDPEWILFPFPPEARNTFMVKATIAGKKLQRVSFLPCLINPQVQAEILSHHDKRSQGVLDYVVEISRSQGLETKFSWESDEIVVWKKE